MSEMEAIIKEFLVESRENLDQLDRDLVELEGNPSSGELLARIFRTVHSIKGATGFLGFEKLGAVAHVGENLLSRLRDGVLVFGPEMATALLSLVDAIRKMLSDIETMGHEGDANHAALVEMLTRLQDGAQVGRAPPVGVTSASATANPPRTSAEAGDAIASTVSGAPDPSTTEVNGHRGHDQSSNPKTAKSPGDADPIHAAEGGLPEPWESASLSMSGESLRVDVHQLDRLMNLVGELVLARNQVLQISSHQQDAVLLAAAQRLNLLTSELQEGVAKARMQPIDSIWRKFPRLVRDLKIQCRKQIRLEMDGKETELDKAILEAVKDPLTHLIRNAIDHGIETPEARRAAGKPAEGRLVLRAFHENGQVNIEISDDGAGIDLKRVREKAIDRHLVTPQGARLMDDQECLNLIFLPGFSTATTITSISGRGVGLDVVRTNIEKVGGTVDIRTQSGRGTTIQMRIPLTLAIIPALIVNVGADRYAIPQINVFELLQLNRLEEEKQIEWIQGMAVCRLREQLLPLVFLDAELQVKRPLLGETPHHPAAGTGTVVVLQTHDRHFGLVVDQVHAIKEIVVKPIGRQLKGVCVYAGATIMGDGRVALILDVAGLAPRASVVSGVETRNPAPIDMLPEGLADQSEFLLVFEGPNEEPIAVPLSEVTRLEQFPCSAVETTGDEEVMQYRNEILHLIRIPELLPVGRPKMKAQTHLETGAEKLQVVVCRRNDGAFGLVVDRVLDIVEHPIAKRGPSRNSARDVSVVIQGRVTRILDLEGLSRSVMLPSLNAVEMEA
jgi:two-component system chemotaxis sensor kinase CheA